MPTWINRPYGYNPDQLDESGFPLDGEVQKRPADFLCGDQDTGTSIVGNSAYPPFGGVTPNDADSFPADQDPLQPGEEVPPTTARMTSLLFHIIYSADVEFGYFLSAPEGQGYSGEFEGIVGTQVSATHELLEEPGDRFRDGTYLEAFGVETVEGDINPLPEDPTLDPFPLYYGCEFSDSDDIHAHTLVGELVKLSARDRHQLIVQPQETTMYAGIETLPASQALLTLYIMPPGSSAPYDLASALETVVAGGLGELVEVNTDDLGPDDDPYPVLCLLHYEEVNAPPPPNGDEWIVDFDLVLALRQNIQRSDPEVHEWWLEQIAPDILGTPRELRRYFS